MEVAEPGSPDLGPRLGGLLGVTLRPKQNGILHVLKDKGYRWVQICGAGVTYPPTSAYSPWASFLCHPFPGVANAFLSSATLKHSAEGWASRTGTPELSQGWERKWL